MATIKISSTELLKRLQAVGKIISSKSATPIMSCFLFEARDEKLTITAADASGSIKTSIEDVSISEEITICYESKMLLESLKTLPEQPIIFDINPDNLETVIKYHGGKFQMMGEAPDKFPVQKKSGEGDKLEILSGQLLRGIDKVSFCVANDDLRPILNAVLVEINGKDLNFVASDGHRLGILTNPMKEQEEDFSFALPQKIANTIKGILPKGEEPIQINVNANNVCFNFPHYIIHAQLLEGKFPNYRSVVPKGNYKKMTITVADLKAALSRVMVFTNQTSQLVVLDLRKNELVLSGQDVDFSINAEERLQCESQDEIRIGFKGSFLSEILSSIDSDRLVMTFSDPTKASLIMPEDNIKGEDLTYLLMPIMVID